MKTVLENKEFLEKFVTCSREEREKLLKQAKPEEIFAIHHCVLNWSEGDNAKLSKVRECASKTKTLRKLKNPRAKKICRAIRKKQNFVVPIVASLLARALQEAILYLYAVC